MEIKEYKLLKSTDEKIFEVVVNDHLQNGWILLGELKISISPGGRVYIRELVKVENDN